MGILKLVLIGGLLLLAAVAGGFVGHQLGLARSAFNAETAASAIANAPLCGEIRQEGQWSVMVVSQPWNYKFYGSAPQARDGGKYAVVHLVPVQGAEQIQRAGQGAWNMLQGLWNRLLGGGKK